jgi:hypothetical protein
MLRFALFTCRLKPIGARLPARSHKNQVRNAQIYGPEPELTPAG